MESIPFSGIEVAHQDIMCILQDSLDHCPLPINANQNQGIDPKCLSMPINSDQGIDWN